MRVLQAVISLARFLGYGSNPLRRKWDRIEGMALAIVVAAAVMAVPLAMWVGSTVYDRGIRQAQVQKESRQQTMAVLLTDAPTAGLAVSRAFVPSAYWVPARWQIPDNAQCLRQPETDPLTPPQGQFSNGVDVQRTGLIQVSAAAKAGSHVPVWVDQAGRLVDPPLAPTQAQGRAVFAGVATVTGAVVLLLGLLWIVRGRLDRCRLSWWDAEWARYSGRCAGTDNGT